MIKFYLNPSKEKKNEKSPDWYGKVEIDGKTVRVSGWNNQGEYGPYISVQMRPDEPKADSGPTPHQAAKANGYQPQPNDDEIPF